ncbi:MAG: deoxyribonuclease IV [Candidatus Berkelbacteria bacterium]|nr:deoxyribonuclease IV [Candidatus Berkelbacteria bacterium]
MKFGAHISTAKPFSDSVLRAKEIGCECMQIFANPPQRWNPSVIPVEEVARFRELNKEAQIRPTIIHSIYLINLASENPFYYEQSIKSLIDDMQKAYSIGAIGVNTHLGSTKGRELDEVLLKVVMAIKQILAATNEETLFIIENSAGAGHIIGDTIEEIGKIIQSVNSPRVKVLIDTAHAFESGYNLRDSDELNNFINKFDELIDIQKLIGFHLNDSKTALNSKHDRHADIGKGEIGLEMFKNIINHPELSHCFGILETPQDEISWSEQLESLRKMEEK